MEGDAVVEIVSVEMRRLGIGEERLGIGEVGWECGEPWRGEAVESVEEGRVGEGEGLEGEWRN